MIVDFHAYVGDWPPYPLSYRDPPGLLRLLDRCAIEVAFVSGLDGLFAYNAGEANAHLAEIVAPLRKRLRPVGTLNPALPTWRADLADGSRRHRLAGFRLHPAYHGYRLDNPEVAAVAQAVGEAGLPLFVSAFVDEERFQHPALRIPAVPLAQMRALSQAAPATTLVVNNLSPEEAATWLTAGLNGTDVWFDIANMDKESDGLVALVRRYGTERLVFGSQAPFLYPEAIVALALLGGLDEAQGEAVLSGSWQRSAVLSRAVAGDDL
jgi:uncharacterized protein